MTCVNNNVAYCIQTLPLSKHQAVLNTRSCTHEHEEFVERAEATKAYSSRQSQRANCSNDPGGLGLLLVGDKEPEAEREEYRWIEG